MKPMGYLAGAARQWPVMPAITHAAPHDSYSKSYGSTAWRASQNRKRA
jgi:hypothetical protein